jgi:anti-anti-sigma factor
MVSVELWTRACGGYVVVLRGELDATDAENTASGVAALAEGGQQLIIDLEALEYIDCHALGALLRIRETAWRARGDVLLAAPHGLVLRLLTLVGVPGVAASVTAAAAGSAGGDGARRARGLPALSVSERRRVPAAG